MAGRGRGIAAFSFNIEALGIGRGSMPDVRVGPSPLFPMTYLRLMGAYQELLRPLGGATDFKPVPLRGGEDEDYMLALKQEMRVSMQRLPHNIKAHSISAGVEKYTQRYLRQRQMDDAEWTPDCNLIPKELMPQKKRTRAKTDTKKKTVILAKDAADMLNKLDELAKKDEGNPEKSDDETEKKEKENEEEEEIDEEECDEEDIEEENDYIESYFDNGEEFGAVSDDNVDGEATY